MWNILDIKCPSDDLCKFLLKDSTFIENLRDFVTFLTTSADRLTSDHPIWSEMEVLRNIQAKYKRILRCDKFLLYMFRVGQCLKKMVLLNLSRSYLDLAERFLNGLQSSSKMVQLPSQQQIEYILIRTQSAAKLACETIQYSRDAFCFLIQKLKVGHLILDLVMAASITARINVMVKEILGELCNMYKGVLPWRYKLKEGSFKWSDSLNLPEDLEKWVDESESFKPFPLSKSDVNFLKSVTNSRIEEEESDSESIVLLNDDKDKDCCTLDTNNAMEIVDFGEIISRHKKTDEICTKKSDLSESQMQILQRILNVRSLKKLEAVWMEITSIHHRSLPVKLTIKKKKIINELVLRLKEMISAEQSKKGKIKIVSNFARIFVIRLGFTHDQIKNCQNDSNVSNVSQSSLAELKPVKTLKELKILFKSLCDILLTRNESIKHKTLKKVFKSRLADIKLLRENEEKVTAKKLIFCTSKVLLTLCQS